MNKLLLDTQQSYYEYVGKVQQGCHIIASSFQSNNLEQASTAPGPATAGSSGSPASTCKCLHYLSDV